MQYIFYDEWNKFYKQSAIHTKYLVSTIVYQLKNLWSSYLLVID